jgi:hypothetical protein
METPTTATVTKRLILHVGYSKCGSTTIQDTLTANYSRLQENKVLFPKILSESPSWLRFFWEKNLPALYHEEWVASTFRKFSKALREELESSDCETVILSDEGLISVSEETVIDFKRYLEQELPGFEIHIVVIVREPISFFTSRCQQFISDRYFDMTAIHQFLGGKNITNGWSRADNLAMNPTSLYSNPIGLYDQKFSHVHVLEFEEMISDDCGLTHAFLRACGLNIQLTDIRRNESRSASSVELIACINEIYPFTSKTQKNTPLTRYWNDMCDFHSISGEKFKLPLAVCRELRNKTADEVEWLRLRSGINYCDVQLRTNDEPTVWTESFYEDIIRIYPGQELPVQLAILSFIREKIKSVDPSSRAILKRLQGWIRIHYLWRSLIRRPMFKYVFFAERKWRKPQKKWLKIQKKWLKIQKKWLKMRRKVV